MWNALVVGAFLVSWAYFTVVACIYKHWKPQNPWAKLSAIIFLFATVAMVRLGAVLGVATALGLAADLDWLYRLSAAAVNGVVFCGFAVIFIAGADLYREAYRRLVLLEQELLHAISAADEQVTQFRQSVIDKVQSDLRVALSPTLSGLTRNAFDVAQLTNGLYEAVNNLVRPLSKKLYLEEADIVQQTRIAKYPRVRLRQVAQAVAHGPLIIPQATMFLTVVLTIPSILRGFSIVFALTAIAMYLGLGLLLIGTQKLTNAMLVRRWLIPAILVALLAMALDILVVFYLLVHDQIFVGQTTFWWGCVMALILNWVPAVLAGLQRARSVNLESLGVVTRKLNAARVRTNSMAWLANKNIALVLHSEIQTGLLASAMRFQSAIEKRVSTSEASTQLLKDLDDVLNTTFERENIRTSQELLERLNQAWGGLVTSELVFADGAQACVDSDVTSIRLLYEVIAEVTNNAIKRGRVTRVSSRVSLSDEGKLVVRIVNDGLLDRDNTTVGRPQNEHGLGTILFDTMTLDWGVEGENGNVLFVATLPGPESSGN